MAKKSSLTKKEIVALTQLLPRLQWPLPYSIFLALCKSVPIVAVYGAIMPDSKHIFLTYRKDEFFDHWCIPGAVLYYNEKISATLTRVIKNKLNIKLKNINFVGYYESRDKREHGVRFLFTGKPIDGVPHNGKYFHINRLPKNFLPAHMPGITMLRKLKKV